MRAAVYIRWSTEDQREGTTLEVQREACRHFILSQGWAFAEELLFVDDGYSGASLERPALKRLRSLCRDGAVDCVVVYKLDRLSRSVVDTVKLVMEEWEGRVALKSARESVDTTSPMGRQVFYLLVSYAEWERSVIRERTSAGKWRRAQEGRNPGSVAPYGYRNAPGGRFLLEPTEAPVIRRIFAEALAQRSARQIATALNGDQVPSRMGCGWSAPVVSKILSNPCYTGLLAYGRSARVGGRRVRRAEPAVTADGVFPQLVDPEVFRQVQVRRSARRPERLAPRSVSGEALLSGIVRCGECGGPLTSQSRQGGRYRYYRCTCAPTRGVSGCRGGYVPQATLDDAVVAALVTQYGLPDCRKQGLRWLRLELRRLQAELRAASARHRAALGRERRIQQAFLAGEIGGRELSAVTEMAEVERAETERETHRLTMEVATLEGALEAVKAQSIESADAWTSLTPAERKSVLRALLSEAELRLADSRLELTLAWCSP